MLDLIHPIRAARHKAGMTQEMLASTLGLTKASVSAWETFLARPSPKSAIHVSRVLGGLPLEKIYAAPLKPRARGRRHSQRSGAGV